MTLYYCVLWIQILFQVSISIVTNYLPMKPLETDQKVATDVQEILVAFINP